MLYLTKCRKERGLTQSALARKADLNNSTVNAIERGHHRPYPGQLLKLATALDWPANDAEALMREVSSDDD